MVEERAHTNQRRACHRPNATSNCLRQQGSLISPFPVSPSGGKPGRAGSPHAAGTLRASQNRWHASCWRLPPKEGCRPLVHPPLASSADALYVTNRTFHLLIKPDNLTCYQQIEATTQSALVL